jgi:hypothetical protein
MSGNREVYQVGNLFYACQPNDADIRCCPRDNMCVYNGCYDLGDKVDLDGDEYEERCVHGSEGKWVEGECDTDSDCPYCYQKCDVDGSETGTPNTCYDFRSDIAACEYYDYCECGYIPETADCNYDCSVCTGTKQLCPDCGASSDICNNDYCSNVEEALCYDITTRCHKIIPQC